ncbi:jg25338 [Pararge aegeria aegeria]|uniref:Jg25338 protein n=1 Tax=Pararge aegeria aegeria TaxID=348720 RepID=A0A8S4RYZ9_9NEOP|nr:jg25338 [Pararge aegeria aegeria]
MGCTSSAPNMPEIAANTTETPEDDNSNVTDMKVGEDVIIDNDLKDTTVSKVLPICDSLEENIQLARNSNSFTKTDNEEREQGGLHLSSGKIFHGKQKNVNFPFVIFVEIW